MERTSLCVLMVLLTACSTAETRDPELPAPAAMSVEQTEAARQALVAWFECEECEEGELQAVAEFGERVVPSLRAALLEGASAATEELVRHDLADRYRELQEYARTHPEARTASSKEEFVAMYLGNLHAQYKTRAAEALSRIGGAAAVRALEEGRNRTNRPDVRASIEAALATAKR